MRKQHRTGRIIIVLAFLLCAVFLRTAHAEEIEGSFPYETSGISGKPEDNEFTYYYSDSFFEETSYVMNPDLARLSMRLAIAGFGTGSESDATNLLAMFDCLAIRYDDETVHYVYPDADTIGYAYGVRDISDDEVLIVTVVRGGNYQSEWAGNFTLGTSEDHQGFRECADRIVQELREYIQTIPAGKKVSILLTGYSRGAAVSNLAASDLDKMASESGLGAVAPDNIYAYCFACPQNTRRTTEASGQLYRNIFSFVHPADPVPKVAPGEWGYGRFGTTYLLPTAINDDDYDAYYEEFLARFRQYSLAEDFKISTAGIVKMDRAIATMADTLMSPAIYVMTVQDSIRSAFLKGENGLSVVSSFLGGSGDVSVSVDIDIGYDSPFVAHAPELYLAATDAIGDGTGLQINRTDYNYFTCECDMPVMVYDSTGNLVVSRDGKKVIFEEDSPTYGAAYELKTFLFDCPSTETYYAVFSAENEKQKFTLKCGRFDSLASRDALRYDYKKETLKKGECAVLVLSPDGSALYVTGADNAEQMLADLIQGKTTDTEPVKPDKVTVSEQKEPEELTPTPSPSPEPTTEVTPAVTETPAVPSATPSVTEEPDAEATPTATGEAVTPTAEAMPTVTSPPSETGEHAKKQDGSNTPGWIIPVIGASVGLCVVLTVIAVVRRRRKKKTNAQEQT